MAQILDWVIYPSIDTMTTVNPHNYQCKYDMQNITISKIVKYGERDKGIKG
jgi:hypothetical protein